MLHPTMAGEDFAFMLNAKRGSYILLGSGRGQTDPTPHQPDYDFNDEILPIGASYWATLAERLLPQEDCGPIARPRSALALLPER